MQTKTHHGSLFSTSEGEVFNSGIHVPHERLVGSESCISIIDVVEELEVIHDLKCQRHKIEAQRGKVDSGDQFADPVGEGLVARFEEWSDFQPRHNVVNPRRDVQQSGSARQIPAVAGEGHEAKRAVRHGTD